MSRVLRPSHTLLNSQFTPAAGHLHHFSRFTAPRKLTIRRIEVQSYHSSHSLRAQPQYLKPHKRRRTAIDPLTFVVAVALSSGVAYIAAQCDLLKEATPESTLTEPQAEGGDQDPILARLAQLYPRVMAPQMPAGRPGNLTSDQEAKLKEMWREVLDVFGVSHETHANGTATPASEGGTPDGKKKKKSRLSMFRSKNKDASADGESADDNDKHGQTKEFQQALASQSPESLREAFWSMSKHDHPDALLLRFLRARKWDVHAALVMMISTMHWRSTEMHVDDDIMKNGEGAALRESKSSNAAEKKEGEDFMSQLRMGKSFLHGLDKEGRPCCYVRVRLHKQGEQTEKSLERYTVYTIETTRMMLRPPVDTATIVFDMTDFSMANMDYTPVKFMIKCFEANYPESLGSVLVYKAPWIFQGIWKIIRGWLDPVVASKVHFASHMEELQAWVPRSQIMKELGGDEDYKYTYVEPRDGENDQMNDTATRDKIQAERTELVKSYESETLAWIHDNDAGEGRNRLAERLAENYWRLDPFIRARSLYDRTGIIGKDGKLDFYPKAHLQSQGGHSAGGGGGGADEVD